MRRIILSIALMASIFLGSCAATGNENVKNELDSANGSDTKLKLIFTLDVEDKYGSIPNMMDCNFPDEGVCGVNYIMDTFEKYDMKGVFFVNIYEHLRYSGKYENYMETLIRNISDRGHEVGLHSHSDKSLGFYNDELTDMSYENQEKIIQYGVNFIKENTGKPPISFRGGGYKVNDDTFKILENNGIRYDSSYYYDNSSNAFEKYNALNSICKANDDVTNLVEFPVVRTVRSDGTLSKLDVNNMPLEDIIDVLEQMKSREGFTAAQIMFHSFSFMDQKERQYETPYFQEGTHNAYGIDEGLTQKFEDLLEYVKNDPEIEVVTFEEYDKLNLPIPDVVSGDGIFVCDSQNAKDAAKEFVFDFKNKNHREPRIDHYKTIPPYTVYFVPQDVEYSMNSEMGSSVTFVNNFEPGNVEYAWYIYDCDSKETIDKIMYKKENDLTYTFDTDGHYQVKAFVKVNDSNKSSKIIADIFVNKGNVSVVPVNPS